MPQYPLPPAEDLSRLSVTARTRFVTNRWNAAKFRRLAVVTRSSDGSAEVLRGAREQILADLRADSRLWERVLVAKVRTKWFQVWNRRRQLPSCRPARCRSDCWRLRCGRRASALPLTPSWQLARRVSCVRRCRRRLTGWTRLRRTGGSWFGTPRRSRSGLRRGVSVQEALPAGHSPARRRRDQRQRAAGAVGAGLGVVRSC